MALFIFVVLQRCREVVFYFSPCRCKRWQSMSLPFCLSPDGLDVADVEGPRGIQVRHRQGRAQEVHRVLEGGHAKLRPAHGVKKNVPILNIANALT